MEAKVQLRREMKSRRETLGSERRQELSQAVANTVVNHLPLNTLSCLGLYSSIGTEVDTSYLFDLLRSRCTIAFPRVNKVEQFLDFSVVESLDALRPGSFNVAEPTGEAISMSLVECIMVPGLAFDKKGGRLGYGGGYYDKTLREYEGLIYGLAFDTQVVEALPLEDHDKSIHGLFTESRGYDFSGENFGVSFE